MKKYLLLAALFPLLLPAAPPRDDIRLPDPADNRWRSKTMVAAEKLTDPSLRSPKNEDAFVLEYGRPLTFDRDWVADEGWLERGDYTLENGAMRITGNKKGFSFGIGTKPDSGKLGADLGINWQSAEKDNMLIEIRLAEKPEKQEWLFEALDFKGKALMKKAFTVSEETTVIDAGWLSKLRNRFPAVGFRFTCKTPGAKAAIQGISCRPWTVNVRWRTRFTLAEKPLLGQASHLGFETYTLLINGHEASKGTDIYPSPMLRHVVFTPFLQEGENTVEFRNEASGWARSRIELRFEGVIFGRSGKLTRLLGGNDWEYSLDDGQTWKKPRLAARPSYIVDDDPKIFNGLNPLPMGLLQPRPAEEKYPLFEYDRPVKWLLAIPDGVKMIPACSQGELKLANVKDGWKNYELTIPNLVPGPHALVWTLGEETLTTECVVVGPIPQEEVSPIELAAAFEKRLEPIKSIDCTQTAPPESFIDHSGMYRPAKQNLGKVENGFRHTGEGRWDYFAYTVDLFEERDPVLVEVIVPDDMARCTYSMMAEYYPVRYTNYVPKALMQSVVATGTILTGMDMPLSGGTKALRYLYYPGSRHAAVYVMTGYRDVSAAASRINFYRVKGGLPAMQVPDFGRVAGPYTERLSNTSDTFGAKFNVFLNGSNISGCGGDQAWSNLYRMYEEKIRFLRYTGQNLSAEGLFMYTGGHYPSVGKHSNVPNNGYIDPLLIALKMYKHNNIKAEIGIQCEASAQLRADAGRVSDRRMTLGAPSSWNVDRKGRQIAGRIDTGSNFLHPRTREVFFDLIDEVHQLYGKEPAATGIFLMSGYLSLPGFGNGRYREIDDHEVGYSDYTVELFEKETGIKLGIPATPERFAKRYELLNSPEYRAKWQAWREAKLSGFCRDLAKSISPWKLQVYPYSSHTAFTKGTPAERLTKVSHNPENYGGGAALIAKTLFYVHVNSPESEAGFIPAWNLDPTIHNLINKHKALFLASPVSFFQETDCPAPDSRPWPYNGTKRGVFVPRRAGANAPAELADLLAHSEPETIYTMWLDCNFDTNTNPAMAKFLAAYRSTPPACFVPYAAFRGGNARLGEWQGKHYLKLTNNTPYPVAGELEGKAISLGAFELQTFECGPKPAGFLRFAPEGEKAIRDAAKAVGLDSKLDLWELSRRLKEPEYYNRLPRPSFRAGSSNLGTEKL